METAIRGLMNLEQVKSTGGQLKTLLIVFALLTALFAVGAWVTGESFTSAFSDLISIMHE